LRRGFDSLLKEGEIALCVICFTVTAGAMALSGVVSPPALDTSAVTLSPPAVVRSVNDLDADLGRVQSRNEPAKIAGKTCAKAGTKRTVARVTFLCQKRGKKLVWVRSKAPSPPPTQAPAPQQSSPSMDLSSTSSLSGIETCRIRESGADGPHDLIRTGFPRVPDSLLSRSDVVVQVVPISFPNLQSQAAPADVVRPISEGVTDYFSKVSNGRLKFSWRVPESRVTMPQPVESYRLGIQDRNNGYGFIQDVLNAADSQVDFAGADFVLVLNPETANREQIGISPAQQMVRSRGFSTAEGPIFRASYTSFMTTNPGFGWRVIAHEFAHSLGLPDTYAYDDGSRRFTGFFDLMGGGMGMAGATELFAWHKWQLGFLSDDQVLCVTNPNRDRYWLSPVSSGAQRPEMIVFPTSSTRAVVVESRRPERFDANAVGLPLAGGLLVYEIDTQFGTGKGPIRLFRKPGSGSPTFFDSLLSQGDEVQVGSLSVKNLESGLWGDVVEVSRNS